MNDDATLLRAYADKSSEAAFAELVRRHIDLVYGAALRRTGGDAHTAADIAQQVFIKLARHARKLSHHTVLCAWLYTTTRNVALNVVISDQRRQARNAVALQLGDASSPDWERVRPLLDDAIDELAEADRAAVLLRFFQNRPFAEIGVVLQLSEDAARMRVERALGKLRGILARHGVKSTAAALTTVFANQVGAVAPAGLVGSITSAALSGAATAGLAVAGAGIFMSTKSTLIVSVVALAAISTTFLQWNRAVRAETELAALTADRDGLRSQLATEQQRAKRSVQDMTALRSEVDALKAKPLPVDRPTTSDQRQQRASTLAPDEVRVLALTVAAKTATDAYRAAHNGQEPPNTQALIPYFATPQDGADYVEFLETLKEHADGK